MQSGTERKEGRRKGREGKGEEGWEGEGRGGEGTGGKGREAEQPPYHLLAAREVFTDLNDPFGFFSVWARMFAVS